MSFKKNLDRIRIKSGKNLDKVAKNTLSKFYTDFIRNFSKTPDKIRIKFSIFRCSRGTCRELVCGLKLYEDSDEDLFAQLVASIKTVQESGALVKLSYGGIRYGNIHVPTRVSFFLSF